MHRDLKPSNVLLTPDGRPMLLDFNLSSDARLSDLRIGGTLPYAAPELLRAIFAESGGSGCTVDERSDVYSLGVVLYELLSGSLPFGAGARRADRRGDGRGDAGRAWRGPSRFMSGSIPSDRAVSTVIQRCLAYDPADRPQSAEILGRQLADCLCAAAAPGAVEPATSSGHGRRGYRRAGLLLDSAAFVATRDPYFLREYQAGRQALAAHELGDAVLHFDHALAAKADDPGILFARGQAFQQRGDFDLAVRDYRAAAEHSKAGIIEACHAYCLAQDREYRGSIDRGVAAIKRRQPGTAEVYNNLGYCRRKIGKDASPREDFDKAIALNPALQVAYYNRGLLDLRTSDSRQGVGRRPQGFRSCDRSGTRRAVYFILTPPV